MSNKIVAILRKFIFGLFSGISVSFVLFLFLLFSIITSSNGSGSGEGALVALVMLGFYILLPLGLISGLLAGIIMAVLYWIREYHGK